MWFWFDQLFLHDGGDARIIAIGTYIPDSGIVWFQILSGNVWVGYATIVSTEHLGTVPPLNQWVQLAITFDGTTLNVYQNGVDITNLGTLGRNANPGTYSIGGRWYSAGAMDRNIAGRLADLRVLHRAQF